MDWTQIIVAVVGIVTLEGILKLILIKSTKKSKEIENVAAEVEAAHAANKLMTEQLERSHETIKDLNSQLGAKDAQLEAKNAQIARLTATVTALFDDMCIHKGCRLRKPHQGQGALWYEKYREDPALGADYSSIDTLIKQERKARQNAETEAEHEMTEEEING